MSIEVTEVRSLGDLRRFVELPYRLHAGTPWVPQLKLERYQFLTRTLNPYFKHGTARYFLARRGEAVVCRITAQIDFAEPRSAALATLRGISSAQIATQTTANFHSLFPSTNN